MEAALCKCMTNINVTYCDLNIDQNMGLISANHSQRVISDIWKHFYTSAVAAGCIISPTYNTSVI